MKKRELYRQELEELLEYDNGVMVDKHTDSPDKCSTSDCFRCLFNHDNCCLRSTLMVKWLDSPVQSTSFSIAGTLQLDKLEYQIRNFKSKYSHLGHFPTLRANRSTLHEIAHNPMSTQMVKLGDRTLTSTNPTLASRCNHIVDDELEYGEIVLEMN